MEPRALIRITLASGIIAAIGAAGCSLVKAEDTDSSPDKVTAGGDVSEVLKSTLQLQGGCTAAKVGPRQLLVAARCVSGNEAYAAGNTISFTSSASGTPAVAAADAGASDAATPDAAGKDAGTKDAGKPASNANARSATIAEVKVHPSYAAKCTGTLCDFGKLAASDSPDIAVIILDADLDAIPTIPVDLDPVGEGDALLEVTSSCSTFDAKPVAAQKTARTQAVPAKSVNHVGSPYLASPNLVSRLASSYVVTSAAGWKTGQPRLCKADIGAPLFRAGSASVAGVTSNYTAYALKGAAVTAHHTRVDAASRFKIGEWLTTLGAETIHSCSETAEGCPKHTSDAGTPPGPETDGTTEPGDGGTSDATAPDAAADAAAEEPTPLPSDDTPHSDQLPSEDSTDTSSSSNSGEDFGDAGVKKKKAADSGGCSAAPGGASSSSGGFAIGLVLALGAVIARRRRA
ncbi:MAG TPA: MYXO-CTERM sorting domain-containing protein [Labilithrix sp.]|nr:MYXO-CTERM sorting domain-containing protein [Labilithrix sp.]